MMSLRLLTPALAALMVGCASAPDLAAPSPPPANWLGSPETTERAPDAWWTVGAQDVTFRAIMSRAGSVDDVAVAQARYRQALSIANATGASGLPRFDFAASQNAIAADNVRGTGLSQGAVSATAPLDLSGAIGARTNAARARADAAKADLDAARLQARVAASEAYIALRTAQAQRVAAERGRDAALDSLSLAQSRAAAGLESQLGVAQARAAADAARARPPVFAQAETRARGVLEALLGVAPGALMVELAGPGAPPLLSADGLLDQPASTLARRPDLRAAEARLSAAGFDARAARGDLWPSMSIGATLAAADGATRIGPPQTATVLASLTAPLFNFGRLQAFADAAGAGAQAEAFSYRRQVATALTDVETQRARIVRAREASAAQANAVTSAQDQAALARARYTSGLSSFLDVLTADRAAFEAELTLAEAQGEEAQAVASFAAAIGLGQEP